MQQNSLSFRYGVIVLTLIVLLLSLRPIILGTPIIRLNTAPKLTGQIALSYTSTSQQALPIAGKDFTLSNVQYFDNNQWIVANIKPLTARLPEGGMVVLGLNDGVYQVAVGPGTAFSSTSLQALPNDVIQYIRGIGAVYEPVSE